MPQYLGLDSSTQSLSATVIDTGRGAVVAEESVVFGRDLPEFGAPNGVLPNADPAVKHSDPLMWIAALERLLEQLRARGADLAAIRGISGAGQQHGSVYLARSLASIDGWRKDQSLVDQVRPLLSRPTAPIWMDSATSAECEEIGAAIGGQARAVAVTGSRMIERFTGPQIRRFSKLEPAAYAQTAEIHLVSSFMASILVGTTAPIDLGDGAGMNLLELATGTWHPGLVEATAPGLDAKLPRPMASATVVGELADYFVSRYGFSPRTPVVAFTGDNPSSLVGMGATDPGTAVVSLGTSDTVFAAMSAPRTDPRGFGHVFGNPAGGFLSLICFANGSLARERVAQRVGLDWPAFERAILEETRPGSDGNVLLPLFEPEMTPRLRVPEPVLAGTPEFVAWRQPALAARATVEAQAVSMRLHSAWIGQRLERVLVTGGASRNRGILRVLADVFQAEMQPLSVANSSALGAAVRAAHAVGGLGFDALQRAFSARDASLAVAPDPTTAATYDALAARIAGMIAELEAKA
ncbi:MAG: hypothetical protein JW751_21515 [Polyangiaceae bacterium]|nr:hypothetical protein [Polyangiaceae bacterium]